VTPSPKIQAAGAAGAVTVVLVWGAGLAGLDVTVLISSAAGWLKRD
jgi:hypothetical protein